MRSFVLISTALSLQLLSCLVFSSRVERPWEALNGTLLLAEDSPIIPDGPPFIPPGGMSAKEYVENIYRSETGSMKAKLVLKIRLMAACCYHTSVPSYAEDPQWYSKLIDYIDGTVATTRTLQSQIDYLEGKCPQCSNRVTRKKRSLLRPSLWDRETIDVVVNSDGFVKYPDVYKYITEALDQFEATTCINFNIVSTAPASAPYIHFVDVLAAPGQNECSAFPGKPNVGNVNLVSLGNRLCAKENGKYVYHALLTAMGGLPEHLRPSRDNYLNFNQNAVVSSEVANFVPFSQSSIVANTPFDYGSITMVAPTGTYTKNGNDPVFTTKNPLYQRTLASSTRPSFNDYRQFNTQFCNTKCGAVNTVCQNGGYKNPSDATTSCSKCICPSGYGGDLCDAAAPGSTKTFTYTIQGASPQTYSEVCVPASGSTLTAGTTEKFITSPNYNGTSSDRKYFGDALTNCNWVIKAENPACKVKVRFDNQFELPCEGGKNPVCTHYVEVKYLADQTMTGPRFCCNDVQQYNNAFGDLLSEAATMAVIFDATRQLDSDFVGFKMYYVQECNPRPTTVATTAATTKPTTAATTQATTAATTKPTTAPTTAATTKPTTAATTKPTTAATTKPTTAATTKPTTAATTKPTTAATTKPTTAATTTTTAATTTLPISPGATTKPTTVATTTPTTASTTKPITTTIQPTTTVTSAPSTENCTEVTSFSGCSGVPSSATETRQELRTVKCVRTSAANVKTCFDAAERRICKRCQVNGTAYGACEIYMFGQCIKYATATTTQTEFCSDTTTYGPNKPYESRTEYPNSC